VVQWFRYGQSARPWFAATLGTLTDWKGINFVYETCAFLPAIGILTVLLRSSKQRRAEEDVDHIKRVTEEFGRQSDTFDIWAEKTDGQVAERFRTALAKAGQGRVLDVACGPGVVTAAIASRAASVVAFDATEQMLEKARARCAKAGLRNVQFQCGDAESLPFEEAQFDGLITRLAVHHFANPQRAFDEMFRVLRPHGIAVIVDVVSSEDADESNLQNAIERLRDPSHVRMLPASELDACATRSGFSELQHTTWDKHREFEEWMGIVNAPHRVEPIRTVLRALANAGCTVGMGLSVQNGQVVFFHRWRLLKATKPLGH
jgi:ubiquinone/menaquinone biosynthesis C-methylase UbiE